MKVTPWEDSLSGSARVRLSNPAPDGSEESLFSLLLKVETKLRVGLKDESQYRLGRHKSLRAKVSPRSISSNLSRYVE
jgi:hypothetical protein